MPLYFDGTEQTTEEGRSCVHPAPLAPRTLTPVLLWQPLSPHTMYLFDEDAPSTSGSLVRRSIIVGVFMVHHRRHLVSPMPSLSRWSAPLLWSTIQIQSELALVYLTLSRSMPCAGQSRRARRGCTPRSSKRQGRPPPRECCS